MAVDSSPGLPWGEGVPYSNCMTYFRSQLAALAVCAIVALTGCQGVTGGLRYTQVRFIAASPDAPALDIYQNGSVLLYSVGFGTASSYTPISPGSYSYAVDTAGLSQQLASATGTLAPGGQYTVLIGNTIASLQVTILKDQTMPAPAGQFSLRVLDQATRSHAVDVYLLPAGGTLNGTLPFATAVTFGNAPVYGNAPSGTYSIVVLAAGAASSSLPLYTGSQTDYAGGSVHTVVLLDPSLPSSTGVQVVAADDIE